MVCVPFPSYCFSQASWLRRRQRASVCFWTMGGDSRLEIHHAKTPNFDDSKWRSVDLPHDWSTESPPQADAPSEGHGGYHRTGIGWYRRGLDTPESTPGFHYRLEFDGVYHHAEVWLNGKRLGEHQYGYTPFFRYHAVPKESWRRAGRHRSTGRQL